MLTLMVYSHEKDHRQEVKNPPDARLHSVTFDTYDMIISQFICQVNFITGIEGKEK